MFDETNPLGILQPLGGGDPIPLLKEEMIVGRRLTCDICLDFENVSGKHCILRLINGIWHIRDLASTNGTTLNTLPIQHEETVLPEDQVGIAGHYFRIEYEPTGPAALTGTNRALEEDEDIAEQRRQHSLMELAGLAGGDLDKMVGPIGRARPKKAPERIVHLSPDEADFRDSVPEEFAAEAAPKPEIPDDDFLKLIEEDVKKQKP